jgi:hypothetical protein
MAADWAAVLAGYTYMKIGATMTDEGRGMYFDTLVGPVSQACAMGAMAAGCLKTIDADTLWDALDPKGDDAVGSANWIERQLGECYFAEYGVRLYDDNDEFGREHVIHQVSKLVTKHQARIRESVVT